jgi:CDP-glycerol glycerophosphotransferase (TagB/SpsB family)
MKFNKYKISHYFIFSFAALNYYVAILLRQFMKSNSNSVLLYGHKLVGNLEIIFKDERFSQKNVLFITLNYKDYLRLKKIYGDRILTALNIIQLLKGLKSKTLIASHGIFLHNAIKKLGIKTIYCGHAIHGSLPKDKDKDKANLFYETFHEVWLHSPYDKKILTQEYNYKGSNLDIIGFPRNQAMLENTVNINRLKNNNNLNGKKIILYAPTSNRNNINYIESEFSISNTDFIEFIRETLLESDIVLIIKTHINDETSKEIEEIVNNSNNILFQNDLKLDSDYDSLLISDVLITDFSTIYVDYLLLEKPIYIINNPDPDPQRQMSSILSYTELPILKNKQELVSMIEKLKYDQLNNSKINNLKNKIYQGQIHLETIDKILKKI